MMMSSFRASPHRGHLEWVKHIVRYLSKFRFAELRILTDEPDFSDRGSRVWLEQVLLGKRKRGCS
jgi:hypothetical protein